MERQAFCKTTAYAWNFDFQLPLRYFCFAIEKITSTSAMIFYLADPIDIRALFYTSFLSELPVILTDIFEGVVCM